MIDALDLCFCWLVLCVWICFLGLVLCYLISCFVLVCCRKRFDCLGLDPCGLLCVYGIGLCFTAVFVALMFLVTFGFSFAVCVCCWWEFVWFWLFRLIVWEVSVDSWYLGLLIAWLWCYYLLFVSFPCVCFVYVWLRLNLEFRQLVLLTVCAWLTGGFVCRFTLLVFWWFVGYCVFSFGVVCVIWWFVVAMS